MLNGCQGFTAFYQPVFAEDKKVPYGAEALMRFTSEKLGMISPAEFIPILEETGLIIPVGRWMMREAMGKCSEIRKVLPDFRVSINISQVQASKSDVIQDISAGLVSIINMLQPEMIVLGYDGIDWPEDYVKKLEILINDRKIAQDGWNIPVKKAYFGKQAQLVGAAALVVNSIFKGELQFFV